MPKLFHFRFSDDVERKLTIFAEKHSASPRVVYKLAWANWCESNANLVDEEICRLKAIGYEGDVKDKMYKAGRYYFGRSKLNMERTSQKNRLAVPDDDSRYKRVNKRILNLMDAQISRILFQEKKSPAFGLQQLLQTDSELLGKEIIRLERDLGMSRTHAADKLKRTYKNRYQRQRRLTFARAATNTCPD